MKTVTVLLFAVLAALVVMGCAANPPSPATAQPSAGPLPPDALTVSLLAQGSKFDQAELRVRAGEAFAVLLRNEDADVHNFELRDESGTTLFRGELFRGPAELQQVLAPLPAGRYAFLCTAHPYMKGTLLAD